MHSLLSFLYIQSTNIFFAFLVLSVLAAATLLIGGVIRLIRKKSVKKFALVCTSLGLAFFVISYYCADVFKYVYKHSELRAFAQHAKTLGEIKNLPPEVLLQREDKDVVAKAFLARYFGAEKGLELRSASELVYLLREQGVALPEKCEGFVLERTAYNDMSGPYERLSVGCLFLVPNPYPLAYCFNELPPGALDKDTPMQSVRVFSVEEYVDGTDVSTTAQLH